MCEESDMEFAGAVCSPSEPCPIFVELSTITRAGSRLFAGGNLHTESATLTSLLMVSDDAGTTWKEPYKRQRGKAIDQIQFLDATRGWAAGETQYPLPRDPFVLLTTDNGATWREYPIGEEGSAGSVERLRSDSPLHGELIVDAGRTAAGGRYQRYETETGGTSWTIRAKTDQLPKAPQAAEEITAVPAQDGKNLRIDEPAGTTYRAISMVAFEAAKCAFEPGQLKEPEPEPEPAKQ